MREITIVGRLHVPRDITIPLARICHPLRQSHFLESTGLGVSRGSEKYASTNVEIVSYLATRVHKSRTDVLVDVACCLRI
jgi:hypothetical protein